MPALGQRGFALLVGINEYLSPQIPDLRGCVNDVTSIYNLLVDHYEVDPSHIARITNREATRNEILSIFQTHLVDNPAIDVGDPIIFYFSGHGARVDAPEGWYSSEGVIEVLCPSDEGTLNEHGAEIPGIPDLTVNALLRNLASRKGNNITVILDCCHSGGASRQARDDIPGVQSRNNPFPTAVFPELDRSLWMAWYNETPTSDPDAIRHYDGYSSYVLMAACRQDELAYEDIKGPIAGEFTSRLIERLSDRYGAATYSDLIYAMKLRYQTPQCEGAHRDQLMFNIQPLDPYQRRLFALRPSKKSPMSRYQVEAGEIHGVTIGTEFSVVDVERGAFPPRYLCTLVAKKVGVGSATLEVTPALAANLPASARAVISHFKGDTAILKVFVDPGSDLTSLEGPSIALTDASERAHVSLLYDGRDLHVTRADLLNSRPVVSFPIKADATVIPHILEAISHFRYHLTRLPPGNKPMEGEVSLELYRLGTRDATGFQRPVRENLFAENHAHLPDADVQYGICIKNATDQELYPYLFYFDPSEYSIQAWYLPTSAGMLAPLMGAQSSPYNVVTVGYGSAGGDPIEFNLEDDLDCDSGYIKLFVSTKYVDMRYLVQESAMETSGRRDAKRPSSEGVWGTVVASVTVSR